MASVLIVSAFGSVGGGGIFGVASSRAERIDRTSSTGLACDGRRLARLLKCSGEDAIVAEVVIYDERGVQRYLRLDDAASAHDIAWDGENVVVVSSWHNAVRWFAPTGQMVHEVRFAGPTDNWHINCVARRDDTWYATMFGPVGPFGRSSPAREGAGRLVRLMTGEEVIGGLTGPHTPRWLDGQWLVCNSGKGELIAVDEGTRRIVRRVECGNWTRGLAWNDEFLYVGTSHQRSTHDSLGHGEVVVLDRKTWTIVERITVPSQEIYDLEFISQSLHGALRRGFDVNPLRTREFRQHRLIDELGVREPRSLWPTGDPLPWSDFRCTIACTMPATWAGGTLVDVPLCLTNRSASFFTSAPPAPVYVSYKWIDPATGTFLTEAHAYRSPLPRTVFPGESIEMTARVVVPWTVAHAVLRITAIQEGVSWFDDQDSANAIEFTVEITPARPTVWEPTVS